MTLAAERPLQQKPLSFDEFLVHHGDDNRYELIDGEVFDLEPTGLHEEVAAFITTKACVQIDIGNLPWFVLQRGLLRPENTTMTEFRPDVAVIDRRELEKEPLWTEQSILTLGTSIKFVAEVVSSNWQNDYARKLEDYAALGITEYWIADHAALGGIRHIGKPKRIARALPGLRCTFGGRSTIPDISVFLWNRIPCDENGSLANTFSVAPDWTIEILSPDQSQTRVTNNILHCLQHGTEVGWLIDPSEQTVFIYLSQQTPEVLDEPDSVISSTLIFN